MRNTCQVSNTEFLLVNTERFIVFVMSLSRLHKLNSWIGPTIATVDGKKTNDSPAKYCFALLNDDKILNNETQKIIR